MKKVLYSLVAFIGFVFIVSLTFKPYNGSFIVKTLPVWLLAVVAYRYRLGGSRGWLLFAGVLWGSVGDIFLDLDPQNYFVFGLGSFLVGHVLYILFFLSGFQLNKLRSGLAAVLIAFSIGMAGLLLPRIQAQDPNLVVPVMVYLTVILCMGLAAVLRQPVSSLSIYGSVVFMLSDSLIALRKFVFVEAVEGTAEGLAFSVAIMFTYYLAQFLIVEGGIRRLN
jgi:uncharacterized membrane protein YhhN